LDSAEKIALTSGRSFETGLALNHTLGNEFIVEELLNSGYMSKKINLE